MTFARTENGGRAAVRNVDPGVDQQQKRRFPVNPGRMQFLFISRCGGSLNRLPWRLPRYTLAYSSSNGKICQLPRVFLRRLVWLRAESQKIRLCRRENGVLNRGALCYDLPRAGKTAGP